MLHKMQGRKLLQLRVNGETQTVAAAEHHTLLEVLREDLQLTGTKHGCELGECGACTVLLDGKPVLSCLTLAAEVADGEHEVETIEGMAVDGQLHPLQKAFASFGAAQCGYCIPGMLLSARHLLSGNPNPSDEAVLEALSGNLCRCTGYQQIVEAVHAAAREVRLHTAKPRESAAAVD